MTAPNPLPINTANKLITYNSSASQENCFRRADKVSYHGGPMALYFKIEGDKIVFFGDTFNHRPAIKALGARFNGSDKTWTLSDSAEMRDRAAQIAKPHSVPPGTPAEKTQAPQASKSSKQSAQPLSIDPSMGLTISQLMQQADRAINQSFPTPIWVVGEIQSCARRAGGTIYLDMAEGKSGAHQTATVTVKCNVWQSTMTWLEKRHGLDKIQQIFVDGNRLRALVQVKLYKDRGQISLTIEDIDPLFTQGALALARAELLKKLRARGLDQKNKLLPVPSFPLRIGLITAEGSRAYSDFSHQLIDVGGFGGTLIFIPCTMQGDQVPQRVVAAIELAEQNLADIIVICRGGGSAADLRWFDGEEIALAIAQSKTPIIAAIGHHDDTCVAEEICHTREKTPTAAADRVLDVFADTRATINEKAHSLAVYLDREITKMDRIQSNLKERLSSVLDGFFSSQSQRLLFLSVSLTRSFETSFSRQSAGFISMAAQLNHSATNAIQQLTEATFSLHQKLTALDPTPWLKSGWTQLMASGRQINSVESIDLGDTVTARLLDGSLQLQVKHKTHKHKG